MWDFDLAWEPNVRPNDFGVCDQEKYLHDPTWFWWPPAVYEKVTRCFLYNRESLLEQVFINLVAEKVFFQCFLNKSSRIFLSLNQQVFRIRIWGILLSIKNIVTRKCRQSSKNQEFELKHLLFYSLRTRNNDWRTHELIQYITPRLRFTLILIIEKKNSRSCTLACDLPQHLCN